MPIKSQLQKRLGEIGIGTVILLASSLLGAGAWVVGYVNEQVQPVQAEAALAQKQNTVLGADIFYICQALKTHCEPIPTN